MRCLAVLEAVMLIVKMLRKKDPVEERRCQLARALSLNLTLPKAHIFTSIFCQYLVTNALIKFLRCHDN